MKYDVYALGAAIMDILVSGTDADLETLKLPKSEMILTDGENQGKVIEYFPGHSFQFVSGGSIANTLAVIGQLGGSAALCATVGDDRIGSLYQEELSALNVDAKVLPLRGEKTGTCVSIITPDKERTMSTHLGASGLVGVQHLNEEKLRASKWFAIEGYRVTEPSGVEALHKGIAIAKDAGIPILLTLSNVSIIRPFREIFEKIMPDVTFLVVNEDEALEWTGTKDIQAAFATMQKQVPMGVLSRGKDGAMAFVNETKTDVKAYTITPVDNTGAGDAFLGGMLFGMNRGFPLETSVKLGCFLGGQTVAQIGARLKGDVIGSLPQELRTLIS
jgi:sugar/nucleoside kinase (ribokinase family)